MNKIVIPIVLGVSLLLFIVFKSCGSSSNKVTIEPNPNPVQTCEIDSVVLKVYLENSGSMDAYMSSGSTLKDAVYDYISAIKKEASSCELNYVNSKVIQRPNNLYDYIKNLTPSAFRMAGGNRTSTDLRDIFNMILANHSRNTVSVFVSDCILDVKDDPKSFFGNCQISLSNIFSEVLDANENLGVQIAKMESTFDGMWYCGNNKKRLTGVRRPYYIWVVGDKSVLAKMNKRYSLADSQFGFKESCAFSASNACPFEFEKKHYVVSGKGYINVEILADFSQTLQPESFLTNVGNYSVKNPTQVAVVGVNKIAATATPYTHVVSLTINSPQTIKEEKIDFECDLVPSWVEWSNDDTGDNVEDNMDKTTGIKYLITGVANAYKNSQKQGNMSFGIKNK